MAGEGLTMRQMAMIVGTLGVLSYFFGVLAANNDDLDGFDSLDDHIPVGNGMISAARTPPILQGGKDDAVMCIAFGYISFAFLVASTAAGYLSLFYPYGGNLFSSAAPSLPK